MTIDVYDDRIRFLGYDVPFDTSKLPATHAADLVRIIQESVDTDAEHTSDDLRAAEDDERRRILDLLGTRLNAKAPTSRHDAYVEEAAKGCAKLVLDNFLDLTREVSAENRTMMLKRWFEHELRSFFNATVEDATDRRVDDLREFIEEMKAA